MSFVYYIENTAGDPWFEFFSEYMRNLSNEGLQLRQALLLYHGKMIFEYDGIKTGSGYPRSRVVGIEFETEEDKTHFLLKFKGKICKTH